MELEDNANSLANGLIEIGLGTGDRVVIMLPNCLNVAISMAAVAKAGGIIVPVSTRLTGQEIKYLIDDSNPFAVIYSPDCRDIIKDLSAVKNFIKITTNVALKNEISFNQIISNRPSKPPNLNGKQNEEALLCYTSGTTGEPKGVISTHQNIIFGQCWLGALEWELHSTDRMLCITPMAHRIGIARLAGCFCLGSTLIIQEKFDPLMTIDLIEKENITHLGVVPTIVRMLLPQMEKYPAKCKNLKSILATGESFPISLKKRLFTTLPNLRLYNFYSQTEAGLVSCLKPEQQETHPESIGLPANGVEIRIVDGNLNDVPVESTGEMLVRCGKPGEATVMKRYFNRSDDTDATFVDGWLRTGDLGRRDKDGYFYFVDRLKDMIISGGLNIYSREVEIALESYPSISEAAVIGVPDSLFGEAVMAFLTCKELTSPPSDKELSLHCQKLIASYKKPRHIHFLDQLPRNRNGKIAKAELRTLSEEVLDL